MLFVVPAYPVTQVIGLGLLIAKFNARRNRKRLERMRHILNILGERPYVSLRTLIKTSGLSKSDLINILNEMIAKGYLGSEAYIDYAKNVLILERAYAGQAHDGAEASASQFSFDFDFDFDEIKNIAGDIARAMKNSFKGVYVSDDKDNSDESAEPTRAAASAPDTAQGEAAAEATETAAFDHEALDKLRLINEQIIDAQVSRKIERIAELTDDIYDFVEQNPERAGEVRKFMNYYLPTTIKLLGSYGILERQSYQGENIIAARKNIEDILDTLVHAFEKQLDRLFAADAVDISSDIQVLETMIAKDGLTQQALKLKL